MKQYKLPIINLVLTLLIGGLLMGCDEEKTQLAAFPHKPHYEMEISCDSCHELDEEEGVSMPEWGACTTCHEPDDDIFSGCNECHEQAGVEITDESIVSHREMFAQYLPENWSDVQFQHAQYLEGEESECLGCHTAIPESEASTVKNLPSMENAMAFNEEHGISNECKVCHTRLDEFTPPSSHDSFWPDQHGRMMEFQDKQSCLLCHKEATCNICHQTEKPRSHTNLWRRKTHGIQAAFDRSSCMVCHRNDECESCHRAAADPIPAAEFHHPDAPCVGCHAPQGGKRQAGRFIKLMPHRMMMGTGSQKCLECHMF